MSISNLLGRLLGGNGGSIELRQYECVECGHTFDSAKRPERAQCMECLSNDVDVGGAENSAASASRITGLVRKAALGRLTLPCEVDAAGRALLLIAGPPNVLNRKGIERAQNWLVEETGCTEVRYGNYPLRNEDVVAAVVLLSGLTEVPRVDALRRGAVAAHDATGDLETANGNGVDELLDDELDPLF